MRVILDVTLDVLILLWITGKNNKRNIWQLVRQDGLR